MMMKKIKELMEGRWVKKRGGNSQIGSCKKGDEGKGKKYTETGWYICGKKFKFILSANPQFWERDTRRNK